MYKIAVTSYLKCIDGKKKRIYVIYMFCVLGVAKLTILNILFINSIITITK